MFNLRSLTIVLALATVTAASERHRRHKRYVVVEPQNPPAVEGEPISPEPDDETISRWNTIEEEDARRGREADEARGVKRYPDIEIANLSRDGNIWIGGEP